MGYAVLILDEPQRSDPCDEYLELPQEVVETTQTTDLPNEVDVPDNEMVDSLVEPPVLPAPISILPDLVENNAAEENLPNEILDILGEAPIKDKKFGPALNANLAIRWEHTATNGLSKEAKKDICDKHLVPDNCKNIEAPLLNQEVKAALSDVLNKKDKAIETKQKQIALIITCLGDALSQVLSTDNTNIKLIKSLNDAGKLACDLQHMESMIRRGFVCSSIKKEIKDHLYTTKIDSHLFGSQLGDLLKAAKAINKTGAEMKTEAPAPGPSRRLPNLPQNLNMRRPLPPMNRQTGAAARRPLMSVPINRPEYQRLQRHAPPLQPQQRAPYKRSQTQAPRRR